MKTATVSMRIAVVVERTNACAARKRKARSLLNRELRGP
jgi:hypothetical protein